MNYRKINSLIGHSISFLFAFSILFSLDPAHADDDAIDMIIVSRDSPEFKMELRIGSGWVIYKTLSIEKTGESIGWIVHEGKPELGDYRKLLGIPMHAELVQIPNLSYKVESLYYISVYRTSGKRDNYFVTAGPEERLKDGRILHSDIALAQWLTESLQIANKVELR